MDIKIRFFFYLAAAICFLLAAIGKNFRLGRSLELVPLGLFLWLFPTLWDTFDAAF